MNRYKILDKVEITQALAALPNWQHVDNEIVGSYAFGDFREAIGFILQVAFVAEALDHHPAIANSYNKVTLRLCTHDAGNKVTDVDVEFAKRISAL
jgi:4a-hydroxytetrahydrobiopterin dehydratase